MKEHSAEIVIVGSGVAGALIAAGLVKAGVRVLILEAGPRVQRGQALQQYERALIKIPESPYPNPAYAPHPLTDALDNYFVQAGPEKFISTYLRQVGGTTWHWLGTAIRFVPDDFRLRSRFGVGADWPISYDDLEHGIARLNESWEWPAIPGRIPRLRGANPIRCRPFP